MRINKEVLALAIGEAIPLPTTLEVAAILLPIVDVLQDLQELAAEAPAAAAEVAIALPDPAALHPVDLEAQEVVAALALAAVADAK